MRYETSIPFRGDPERALKLAADALTVNNFHIDAFSSNQVRFTGPGMNSNRENPLRGISAGEINAAAGLISFRGELGAIEKLRRFLIILIAGMAVFFVVLFGVVLRSKMSPHAAYIGPLTLSPWIVLIPFIVSRTQRQTQKAVDALLNNMAQVSQ